MKLKMRGMSGIERDLHASISCRGGCGSGAITYAATCLTTIIGVQATLQDSVESKGNDKSGATVRRR